MLASLPAPFAQIVALAGVCGIVLSICMIYRMWVSYSRFSRWLDGVAGRRITPHGCGGAFKYLRPLGAIMVTGIALQFDRDGSLPWIVLGIYETILVCFRAVMLRCFRAAVVEALFLMFATVGAMFTAGIALIAFGGLAYANSDIRGGGRNDPRESRGRHADRRCGECRYHNYQGCCNRYGGSVHPYNPACNSAEF